MFCVARVVVVRDIVERAVRPIAAVVIAPRGFVAVRPGRTVRVVVVLCAVRGEILRAFLWVVAIRDATV